MNVMTPSSRRRAVLIGRISVSQSLVLRRCALSLSLLVSYFSPLVASAEPNLPALSPAAQQMIDHASLSPLEQTLAGVRASLQGPALQLALQTEFTLDPAASQAAAELTKLLETAGSALATAQAVLYAIATYLDAYPHDDWPQRFGRTGFYDRITQLRSTVLFLRSMLTYYAAVINRHGQQPLDHDDLEQYRLQLHDMLSRSTPDVAQQLQLWKLRLTVLLAHDQQHYLTQAQSLIDSLLQTHLPSDLEFDLRFESLRLAAQNRDYKKAAAELNQWIRDHRSRLSDPGVCLLQLTMFQAHHLSDRERAVELYRSLAAAHPDLQPTIGRLLIGYHDEAFADTVTPINFVRRLTDHELIPLARHYQSAPDPQYDQAVRLCEAFLRSRPATNRNYPQFLYDAARCRQQLSQLTPGPDHVVAAIQPFIRLGREFPRHRHAPQAAATAASLAYDLFTRDPAEHTDLALAALGVLVGRFQPGRAEPIGPFSQTAAAKQFRYHYALVLRAAGKNTTAAAVFNAVSADSPHRAAAIRHATVLRAQSHLGADPPDPNACLVLLDKLNADDDPRLLHLRTRAYLELDDIPAAISRLNRQLPRLDQLDASLITLTLNTLNAQLPSLFDLHARARHQQLAHQLGPCLNLMRTVDHELPAPGSGEITSRATRAFLELLALTAATIIDNPASTGLPALADVTSQAEKLLRSSSLPESRTNSLWLTRVRAMLALAAGDYEESQQLWYRIRQATAPDATDPAVRYYWWQARYFGLRCLSRTGRPEQVSHIIDVLNHSHRPGTSPWQKRLTQIGD